MTNQKFNFADFETEKLSKNQQKAVRGGDGEDPSDPNKGQGKGSN